MILSSQSSLLSPVLSIGPHRWHFLCSHLIFRFVFQFRCVAPLFHHLLLFFVRRNVRLILFSPTWRSLCCCWIKCVGQRAASRSLAGRPVHIFRLASSTHFATGRTVHIGNLSISLAAVHRHLITSIRTDNHTFTERPSSVDFAPTAAPNTL